MVLKKTIEYLFYFFLFLLPWQTRLIWQDASLNNFTWEYGRLSLYGTQLILWSLLLVYGFWLVKNHRLKSLSFSEVKLRLKKPEILIYWLVALFVLIAGVSVIDSLNVFLSYIRWLNLLEATALMSMILIFDFSLIKISIVLVASSLVQSIFAIWQFFVQYVPANKWLGLASHLSTVGGSIILQTDSERWLRSYGSLPHPNMLGGFLVIGILFLLYLGFLANTSHRRIMVLLSLVFLIPALFFSFSRSAWVALIFSLVILAFWLVKNKNLILPGRFLKQLIIVLLLISICGSLLTDPLITRLQGKEPLEVSSIELRIAFTEQALMLIKNDIFTGTGIGNYTLGVYQQINGSWPGYYYQPVHNIYLLVLAELGIFAALLFYLIILLLLWRLVIKAVSLEKIIGLVAFLAILTISLFDHYFWTMYFGLIIFWLIFALNLKNTKDSSGF